MDRTTRFWDRMAERYASQPVADEAAYQKKLEVTRGYLREGMEVLEFGCGTGSTAIQLAPSVKHILATDLSSRMIDIARRKAEAAAVGNVTFAQSSVDEFSDADETLDAVLGFNVLHLLDDREKVIANVHRLLRPGGYFVSSTVCMGDSGLRLFRFLAPIGRLFGLTVKSFAARELLANLTAAGFEIEYRWQPGSKAAVFVVARKVS